ncbi:hypothetical protein GCM10027405_31720 [Arthrobacter alkaliphilus]
MLSVTHANADLTPKARGKLAYLAIELGWTLHRASERFRCSPVTAKIWVDRHRALGQNGMISIALKCLPIATPGI